jgi:hypothetical protein
VVLPGIHRYPNLVVRDPSPSDPLSRHDDPLARRSLGSLRDRGTVFCHEIGVRIGIGLPSPRISGERTISGIDINALGRRIGSALAKGISDDNTEKEAAENACTHIPAAVSVVSVGPVVTTCLDRIEDREDYQGNDGRAEQDKGLLLHAATSP